MSSNLVSHATLRNWEKLNVDQEKKNLNSRANKKKSEKYFIPVESLIYKESIPFINEIIKYAKSNTFSIESIVLTLGKYLLEQKCTTNDGNFDNILIDAFFKEHSDLIIENMPIKENINLKEWDILGVIYQSLRIEGDKNINGAYYTPPTIVKSMISMIDYQENMTFLDPGCGSGVFLLNIPDIKPEQIYGIDSDPIAVKIFTMNYFAKFPNAEKLPNVVCSDFFEWDKKNSDIKFDCIITNPPWGASNSNLGRGTFISSKETFSLFFEKSYLKLKENGDIIFLFPESILNVKVHKDIRDFILEYTNLTAIKKHSEKFSGVTTNVISIYASNTKSKSGTVNLFENNEFIDCIEKNTFKKSKNSVFSFIKSEEVEIIDKVMKLKEYDLSSSTWALGIVTGNNKEKLKPLYEEGFEPIYKGTEIKKYVLAEPKNYIFYDRSSFQQVAKDEIYRSSKKLVYKFISNKLVFAMDTNKSLFLNSANILIPNIPGMSMETIMAFLNSKLYQFLYIKLFGEIKILKGNLIELPFPSIKEEKDKRIKSLITTYIKSPSKKLEEQIEIEVYNLFGLTNNERELIDNIIGDPKS